MTVAQDTKNRRTELGEVLGQKNEELDRLAEAWKVEEKSDEDGGGKSGVVVSTEQAEEYRKVLAEAKEIKGLLASLEDAEEIKAWSDAPRGTSFAEAIEAELAKQRGDKSSGPVTTGGAFVKSEQLKEFIEGGGHEAKQWDYEGPGFTDGLILPHEFKDIHTGSVGTYTSLGFGSIERDPLLPQIQRPNRVRDLFPARPTTATLIQFFRQTGWAGQASAGLGLGGAGMVKERDGSVYGLKPGPAGLTFESRTAQVKTLAWWESAHRNVLDDEPQLQGIIDVELLYGLRLFEDFQILQGDGTGENLDGILLDPDIAHYAVGTAGAPPAEQAADAIRRGMTKVLLTYIEPTGVVVHPSDWEKIELIKDSQNRYIVSGSVAVGAQTILWRLPVSQTVAMPEHKALVGAFGIGAQLYDRQQANIRISENVNDDFLRNALRVLAEERLALAMKRPEAFCLCTGLNP